MKIEAVRHWRSVRRRRRWLVVIGCVTLFAAVAAALLLAYDRPSSAGRAPPKSAATVSMAPFIRLRLPPPDLLRPISPEEALLENAKRKFSGRPDTAAAAFKLNADATSRDRALECLTQAVYYEAASEGIDGGRAVAQVVLNRMRHPAYPATVCGVVYQGSERPTGCQFTFTCDGSLARIPVPSLWKQARRIAEQTLAGKVFAPVGHSTHYHADYVLPYWADSLDKSVQVGRHIFYRLKGGYGAASTFSQRYGGVEPLPPPPTTVEVSLEAVQNSGPLLSDTGPSNPLQVSGGELMTGSEPRQQLAADTLQGTLLLDGSKGAPAASTKAKPKAIQGCPDVSEKQIKALSSNDLRAGGSKPAC